MSYVSYPFTLDAIGVLESTDIVSKIYEDRLLTLLSTQVGQRPMRPTYGVDLSRAFFENEYVVESGDVRSFSNAVDQAVRSAAQKWIPDITINDVIVSNPAQDGASQVEILITVPGNITTSLNTTTAIFYNDGTITRI